MNINASNMRYNIEVFRKNISINEYGEELYTYSKVYSLKAEKVSKSGNRITEDKEVFYSNFVNWIIYYRNIKESDIVHYKDKKFRILYINDIGYKAGLELVTELIND